MSIVAFHWALIVEGDSTALRCDKKGEENSTTNPTITELMKNESSQITTVVIFVISAVLVIILIFLLAIFIDCRQQKIQNSKVKKIRKKTKQKLQMAFPSLPTIGETSHSDDQKTIVDHMYAEHTDIP